MGSLSVAGGRRGCGGGLGENCRCGGFPVVTCPSPFPPWSPPPSSFTSTPDLSPADNTFPLPSLKSTGPVASTRLRRRRPRSVALPPSRSLGRRWHLHFEFFLPSKVTICPSVYLQARSRRCPFENQIISKFCQSLILALNGPSSLLKKY